MNKGEPYPAMGSFTFYKLQLNWTYNKIKPRVGQYGLIKTISGCLI